MPASAIDTPLPLWFAEAPFALLLLDAQHAILAANPAAQRLLPANLLQPGALVAAWLPAGQIPPLDAGKWLDIRLPQANSDSRSLQLLRQPCDALQAGTSLLWCRDVTIQQHTQQVQLLQQQVLEAVALGRPLNEVLELLCLQVEALAPELICSVLLVDTHGRVHPVAAPSMPPAFSAAIDGAPIGPKAGSCGTAAWRGEPVEVTDIAHDPLWEDYRALALPLGLAACWSSPIKDRDGKVVATFALYYREPRGANPFHRQMVEACVHLCTLAIAHDTSQAQIHRLAYYDDLTGLPNRVLLRDRAHQMIHQAQHDNRSAVMMFLDLDRFKNVNDSLGHIVGDQVLQQVSQRLAHCLHDVDTICRLGGDEFALLLPNCDEHGATQVAQRLQRSLQDGLDISGMTLIPTISIGICLYPFDAGDFESLLKNADIALHQAKIAGKNRFHFFRKQMNDAVTRRLEMEVALRQAILQQQLTIHFQPQLRLHDQSLHGAEVLVRWRHPQLGQVPPNEFIPLAEECGLINQLDNWVLNAACQQLADWDRRGIRVPKLSVNISSVQFLHEDVPQIVAAELRRHGLSSDRLCLEITEGVVMAESGAILQAMHDLQTMGITLSVDDFGTGYSSLGYLKRFPVAELKLDRSFVNDLEHNNEARALSNAIVRIGESLRLAVVAEGIETAGQLALLNQANCDIGQGYYFSRPLPAAEFEAWMQQHGL